MSLVGLQAVSLVYSTYRILAMVKSTKQIKSVFQKGTGKKKKVFIVDNGTSDQIPGLWVLVDNTIVSMCKSHKTSRNFPNWKTNVVYP